MTILTDLAIEAVARAMAPEAWAEHDAAGGYPGEEIAKSTIYAKRLTKTYPAIIDTINTQAPVT